jgi:hypothetical protein
MLFLDHIDAARHIEIMLGDIVVFAIEDFFEAADVFGDRNILPGRAVKTSAT